MLSLLLLQLVAHSADPPRPDPENQNIAGLISSDDYPAEALQNGWQGQVVLDLRITAEGRAKSCRITRSSGYSVLDLKTCEIMLLRARFSPARDADGNPVEDVFRTPNILWLIGD